MKPIIFILATLAVILGSILGASALITLFAEIARNMRAIATRADLMRDHIRRMRG
jgi:hypothetical protein